MNDFNFFYAKRDCPQLCTTCRMRFECCTRTVKRLKENVSLACEHEKLRREFDAQVRAIDYDELDNIPLLKYAKFYKWSDDVLKRICNRTFIDLSVKTKLFITRLMMTLADTCDAVYEKGERQWRCICGNRKSIADELRENGTIRP